MVNEGGTMVNILCKLRLHKWNGIIFKKDKPFITRSCGRCNKVEETTVLKLSDADMLDYIFWEIDNDNESDKNIKGDIKMKNKITERYVAIVGKTIENVELHNINEDKNLSFFELEFTDGSKFSIKSSVFGEYSTEYISGDEE